MNREPLSNADYALVRFDSPDNWMIITALLTFETRLELEELAKVVERSMLGQRRFRQRLVQPRRPGGRAYWEDDETFSLGRHLTPIRTPLPAEPALLAELVSRVMSVGLDFSRPLWQFYLVERYGAASALVMRFHHSLADGVSLVKVLFAMTAERPGNPAGAATAPPTGPPHSRPDERAPGAFATLGSLAGTGLKVLRNPAARADAARLGKNLAGAAGTLVFSPPDSGNPFSGATGEAKRAAWSPPVSIKQLKAAGSRYDGTLNDVLLSAAAGALRRYILQAGGDSLPEEFHGLVPVDMRRDSRLAPLRSLLGEKILQSMGNEVGAALLDLPLEIEDPIQRLQVIHQSMDYLKASGEALAANWLMNLLGVAPAGLHDLAVRFWATKSSTILTNVAGPPAQRFLGGAAIDTIIGWVPNFGPAGLGVSFFSYNGFVRLGVAADQGLAPDPEKIVDYYMEELGEILR